MSEIRVNNIVAADGSSAPSFPSGFSLATGMGITNSPNITGSAVTFSGLTKITNSTDSTSTTTGALTVTGGVGIAKDVYIGAGLSVAGTLTYEDVTNVDSVGLITAKSGVNISGGELKVGSAVTVSGVGVATFIGAAGVAVTITPSTGKVQATAFEGPLTGDVTGAASQVTVTDNESTNENNLITFVADGGTSTGSHGLEMDGDLTYTPALGRLTATQLSGTLQTAAQTNVTSVGTLAGLTVGSAGEFKVGTAVTISSTAGVTTFSGDVIFDGATEDRTVTWDKSADALKFGDSTKVRFGAGNDLSIYHDGSHSYIDEQGTGNLYIRAGTDNAIHVATDGAVTAYYNNSAKLATTYDGVNITGMSTVTTGAHFQGMLREDCNIVANKLSAGTNIDLANGMVHYYTTNETTTATPNIRWNSSYTLNNKMSTGESVTVTIIYKPNGAGYYEHVTVDGSSVTEYWNGGNSPSSANAAGIDVITYTLTKTANATYLVLANVQNYTS